MRILRSPRGEQPSVSLTAEQNRQIAASIGVMNRDRLKIISIVTLFIEIFLIIIADIPGMRDVHPDTRRLAYIYLGFHLTIALTALVCAVLVFISTKNQKVFDWGAQRLPFILTLLLLVCITFITGLDQLRNGQITVLILNLLMCSVLILIKPPLNYLVYLIPFGLYITCMTIFQSNESIRFSHLINGSIFFLMVLVISKIAYDHQHNYLSKSIQLEEANQKLQILSNHDPLTNLSNRRNFEIQIQRELALSYHRSSALILIDLDHFKRINDQYGHHVGDIVLQEVASLIQNNIRDVDLASRWGGEEFLVLLTNTPLQGAVVTANRLRQTLEEAVFHIHHTELNVTASFGVAPLNNYESDDSFLISFQKVDQALYRAKQNGRNQVVVAENTEIPE